MKKQILMSVLVILLVGCHNQAKTTDQPTTEATNDNDVVTQQQSAQVNQGFAITAEEYRSGMVADVKKMGIDGFDWNALNIEKNDTETYFALMLNDTVGTKGTLNPAGQIQTITYVLAQNDNMEDDLYAVISLAGISANLLSPTTNKSEAEAKIVSLLTQTAQQAETTGVAENNLVHDGLNYAMKVDNHQGVWLVISPAVTS